MFITSREKAIINLIVKTSGKHTVSSLSSFLEVSVRTIQRDIKSIENILKKYHLKLSRTSSDGLFIDGSNENIYKLIQSLTKINPTDQTPEERKLSLLITLLEDGPSFKKQVLANQLGISNATLSAYLEDITAWLMKFSVTVTKKRGVGIELMGEEANKRRALASYFLVYFYEELIESIYLLQQGEHTKEKILGYFSPRYLMMIDQLVNKIMSQAETRLVDNDYIALVVYLCVTIQRTESQFLLDYHFHSDEEQTTEFKLIEQISMELEEKLSVRLERSDLHFLTVVLKGSRVQSTDMYYDSVLLGKMIKKLIHDVSNKLHVNLTDDFSLFQGLIAHMEPSIFRLKQELDIFNPLTADIKKKYPVLFMAVKKSLEDIFEDITFPEDEVAFIVLHFGSALLMNEEDVIINAVIVCPTGIGASKMLASRIQKEIAEIHTVEILSIKDFQSSTLNETDLVISTVRLPYTDVDYILVSPLLDEKDIEFIQTFLQDNLPKFTQNRRLENSASHSEFTRGTKKDVKQLLKEIKDVHSSMEAVLNNFKVYRKQHAGNHWNTIEEIVEQAKEEGIHTNTESVVHHLKERESKGGLGIPKTNMGLFHCRDNHVKELVFQVTHLNMPYTIKGMDGEEMQMKNLLLMLAPESMGEREQEILSMISTSLIESDVSMMIFSSANETLIRKKLEELFLDYLQNNLIKE